ncbi:hypothetical protein B0T10DRAFT_42121 [Thelonectria olida]|uniref:N-acetyltransferase domain-containing protein n=1 Tax=Thelonectria olida TaxID=1576542 RepID=A0A9P9AM84_9HYPO|nr:hypothetical protein B0T10DRAFT_42121 [Thelonectria olida]
MEAYVRPLSIRDLDRCEVVESAAFPPAEAASRQKIHYRLTVTPETCYGLFLRGDVSPPIQLPADIPILNEAPENEDATLVAHTISTKASSPVVKDADMAIPPDWESDPEATYEVGHQPNGKTITLHSLAVSPTYQRSGLGKALMKAYLAHMKKTGQGDRVAILTYDRLVPYYQGLGFTHYGKSESNYAGVAWHDLAYVF